MKLHEPTNGLSIQDFISQASAEDKREILKMAAEYLANQIASNDQDMGSPALTDQQLSEARKVGLSYVSDVITGFNVKQFQIFKVLFTCPGASFPDLARKLGITKQAVSNMMHGLAQDFPWTAPIIGAFATRASGFKGLDFCAHDSIPANLLRRCDQGSILVFTDPDDGLEMRYPAVSQDNSRVIFKGPDGRERSLFKDQHEDWRIESAESSESI